MNERLPLERALPLIKQRLGMNYEKIADYCHVDPVTVSNWLHGKGSVGKLVSRVKLKELAFRAQLTITDIK